MVVVEVMCIYGNVGNNFFIGINIVFFLVKGSKNYSQSKFKSIFLCFGALNYC